MSDPITWQPSASLATIARRANLLSEIRGFFAARNIPEMDIPVLGLTGVTDVHIDCPELAQPSHGYLQSSPEYFMKRLLAAGSGSIYCLGKVFRGAELGARHYPEFTMLEWYRVNWDEHQLMTEVGELLITLGMASARQNITRLTYQDIFQEKTTLNPHSCALAELTRLASEIANRDFTDQDRATCLDLIFSMYIEPALPKGIVFVHDYPACQAALAETVTLADEPSGQKIVVARRFEVFVDRMELANGYYELTDALTLRQRFEQDNQRRRELAKNTVELDENLLAAMTAGLPPCAGVALGVDRLLMHLVGADKIQQVLLFADLGSG